MVLASSILSSKQPAIDLRLETIMGYLNLIIMELNLVTLHRRTMLLCTEWHGCRSFPSASQADFADC